MGLLSQQKEVTRKMMIKESVVSSRVVTKRCWANRRMQLIENQRPCATVMKLLR